MAYFLLWNIKDYILRNGSSFSIIIIIINKAVGFFVCLFVCLFVRFLPFFRLSTEVIHGWNYMKMSKLEFSF